MGIQNNEKVRLLTKFIKLQEITLILDKNLI